jgi:all-trans-retinol dehydrogenase (NAD+)
VQSLAGKLVLITGSAAGIGKAIARAFAARGAQLLLVDLNDAQLQATAADLATSGAKVRTYRLDVTDIPGVLALRDRIHQEVGPIDVLVNNAGLVFGGPFLDVPLDRHLTTYRVNVLGLVAMTRPDAHLVNTASASGYVGLPMGATYASSKWAVIGFSESMELELRELGHTHVHVTALCPSYVSTGLFDGAKPPAMTRMLTADRVADKLVQAVLGNRRTVRVPWLVAVTPLLKGVLPFRLFYAVAALLGVTTSMTQWKGHTST